MRLVLCDRQTMFVEALCVALTDLGHEVTATDQEDRLTELVSASRPEVCVVDTQRGNALALGAALREKLPDMRLLALVGSARPDVWAALDDGVLAGVVNKACDIVLVERAIRRVAEGQSVLEGFRRPVVVPQRKPERSMLTDRERAVLMLLSQGASTEAMALELGVSPNTVRTHVQNVLHKTGVNGRRQAARLVWDRELIGIDAVGA
jgi:DNA-binding NarL/FixJ family response regulator